MTPSRQGANGVHIPCSKIDKLACQAQSTGIFAERRNSPKVEKGQRGELNAEKNYKSLKYNQIISFSTKYRLNIKNILLLKRNNVRILLTKQRGDDLTMDDYRTSKEWLALNNIWKSMASNIRENNIADFKILTEFIKENCHQCTETAPIATGQLQELVKKRGYSPTYNYLNDLSPQTKQLVIDLVNDGDKNLYHSVMAIIETHRGQFSSVDDLWKYYSKRYGNSRSYIYTYEEEIREIMELCLARMDERGINPL